MDWWLVVGGRWRSPP